MQARRGDQRFQKVGPFAAEGEWLGIGMGDMLLETVFSPVMRKAFGRTTGLASLVGNLSLIVGLIPVAVNIQLNVLFPVMFLLGPLIIVQYAYWRRRCGREQYAYWRRRCGRERTTQRYLQAEPIHGDAATLG
jgi:hypothetical protein